MEIVVEVALTLFKNDATGGDFITITVDTGGAAGPGYD